MGGIDDYGVLADVPGFPLFEYAEGYVFSEILFVVKSEDEAQVIINDLRHMHDLESNDLYTINHQSVKNAKVLSLEKLEMLNINNKDVTIDKLPFHQLPKVSFVQPDMTKEELIINLVEKAQTIYDNTSEKLINEMGGKQLSHLCGFGFVATEEANTDITRILVDRRMAHFDVEFGLYIVHDIGRSKTQSIEINYSSAAAAAHFLTKELQQKFMPIRKLD